MRSRILTLVFFLVLFFSFPAWAQTYVLFATPHQQFLDNSGRPLAGGKIYTYAAGTTTNQTTFKDTVGTPNTNPIVLDSGGFGTIYLNTAQSYKVVLKNAQGVQQWTVDNIAGTTGTLSTVPLNSILPATGTNTIDNGNNVQLWRWQGTGTAAQDMFAFSETGASTNTGANSSLLHVGTYASSTLWPLRVTLTGGLGFGVAPTTGNVQTFGTSIFMGNLTGNVTGNVTGTAGSLAGSPTQCTTVTQYATGIAPTGNANCNPFTAVFAAAPPITGTTATFSGAVSTGPLTATTGTFSGNVHGGTLQADNLAIAPTYLLNDATGKIVPCPAPCAVPTGGPAPALSAITQALANNTLANSSFTQTWNWVLTGANNGMVIGEGSAGAGTGALVQINGLSNAVTPLDVEVPTGTISQIHFGYPSLSGSGGWLTGVNYSSTLSAGSSIVSNAWTAKSATTSQLALNAGNSGGFTFNGNTGLTPGSTFTPTTLETIAPIAAGAVNNTFYVSGLIAHSISAFDSSDFALTEGATWDGLNWTARTARPNVLILGPSGYQFYGDTGKTSGNTFVPTSIGILAPAGLSGIASINTPGNTTTGSLNVTTNSNVTGNSSTSGTDISAHLQVVTGVSSSTGLAHKRIASCTTPAAVNGNCAVTLTWTVAFADANYTVTCSSSSAPGAAVTITNKIAASINLVFYNIVGLSSAITGEIDCIAMHD